MFHCTRMPMNLPSGFSVAVVGDCISSRPLSPLTKTDLGFARTVQLLRDATVTFGNMETSILDPRTCPGVYPAYGGTDWTLTANPLVAKDMASLGFQMFSRANNHALDWSVMGMRETTRRLDEAGLIHAGCGENRAEARAPRYLSTDKGRIAMISFATTVNANSEAMPPRGEAPGRPGVNTLRVTESTVVTRSMMQQLALMKREFDTAAGKAEPFDEQDISCHKLSFFNTEFVVGHQPGISYQFDSLDLAEILSSIRFGKQHSDFLIASLHAHETGLKEEDLPDFLPELAHLVIDHGADIFLVHGTHWLGPIEIYKGHLILYGLGNFFWSDIQEPLPAELYEKNRELIEQYIPFPTLVTDADVTSILNEAWNCNDLRYFQSIVSVSSYEGNKLVQVKLHPVDLGYGKTITQRGIPRMTSIEDSRTILERIQHLSKPFGTVIDIGVDGIGTINL